MDAALLNLNAQTLSAAPREGGSALPHEALVLMLPLLPLDARARAACVCRAWRAATAHSGLWEALSFERCAARVSNATLASLCARGGRAAAHAVSGRRSLHARLCRRYAGCAARWRVHRRAAPQGLAKVLV